MLKRIKTLKRYSEAILNVFCIKKFLMMMKMFYLYDRIKSQIEILLLKMLKLLIISVFSGFYSDFYSKFKVFKAFFF